VTAGSRGRRRGRCKRLAQGRPVFVDFTAAWCLSCKVNERVALETDAVKQAFAQKNVALFRADWTHADAAISATLQKYHRDGVPLYLLYSPKEQDAPQVLPEVLTPGTVLEAKPFLLSNHLMTPFSMQFLSKRHANKTWNYLNASITDYRNA
jgi:hypothetical protein